jgi:type III restriction enzyme
MRATLFPFQETALAELHEKDTESSCLLERKGSAGYISFTAPTGAGKTYHDCIIEDIIFGHANGVAEPDSVFVWLSICRNLMSRLG